MIFKIISLLFVFVFVLILNADEEINSNYTFDFSKNEEFINIENKAKTGNSEFQYEMYKIFRYGRLFQEQSDKKAFEWLKLSAKNKNNEAMKELAYIYFNGTFCLKKQDFEKSFYWYKQSANLKDSHSTLIIGTFYESGVLVGIDIEKAKYYYDLSINLGNKDAVDIKNLLIKKEILKKEKEILYKG